MKTKLGIMERAVDRYATSRIANFMNAVRLGWNSYSFVFYIGGIAAILVGFFGWAGWISVIITILFFCLHVYFLGQLGVSCHPLAQIREKDCGQPQQGQKGADLIDVFNAA